MIGAILGDVVGSRFEFDPIKTKRFQLFKADECHCTDDTMMTVAVAKALLDSAPDWSDLSLKAVEWMQKIGLDHPRAGYGRSFFYWLTHDIGPYNSFGNGSAMRVSPVAYAARSLEEALKLSDIVTAVTHDHPEGLKGARAVTACIYLALHGASKEEILQHVRENYYPLDRTLRQIRPDYHFDVTCMGSVPESIQCFAEGDSCEDAIRNAVSLGGDSDTMGAIAGSIAEAFYGVPESWASVAESYLLQADLWFGLDPYMADIFREFRIRYMTK